MTRFVVVAFLEPVELGAEFAPGELPLHVTLMPPAETSAPLGALEAAVDLALAAHGPIDAEGGDDELFGPRHDVEVTLVEHDGELDQLHRGLLETLRPLGVRVADGAHIGSGYRPHVTVTSDGDRIERGERVELDAVAILERPEERPPRWVVEAQFPLI